MGLHRKAGSVTSQLHPAVLLSPPSQEPVSAALASLISLRDSQAKLLHCSSSLSPISFYLPPKLFSPLPSFKPSSRRHVQQQRPKAFNNGPTLPAHSVLQHTSLSFQIVPTQASAHSQPGESAHTHAGPRPGSLMLLPVSWSVVTAAVRPTPDEPRPVVGMALGSVQST